MQNNLLNFLQAAVFNKVPADGYALRPKVALTGAIYRPVKAK
jgi:hypothetical protein